MVIVSEYLAALTGIIATQDIFFLFRNILLEPKTPKILGIRHFENLGTLLIKDKQSFRSHINMEKTFFLQFEDHCAAP